MKRSLPVIGILAAFAMLAAACAPSAAPTAAMPAPVSATQPPAAKSAATQPAPTEAMPSGPAMVNLATGALGSHLVAANGMTLYLFTKDTQGSNATVCTGKCAGLWPALLTAGAPQAGSGVDASKLGTFTRADGTTQVTYNGWPLYYYAKDTNPGDTMGENVGSVWFCVSPTGDAIKQ